MAKINITSKTGERILKVDRACHITFSDGVKTVIINLSPHGNDIYFYTEWVDDKADKNSLPVLELTKNKSRGYTMQVKEEK